MKCHLNFPNQMHICQPRWILKLFREIVLVEWLLRHLQMAVWVWCQDTEWIYHPWCKHLVQNFHLKLNWCSSSKISNSNSIHPHLWEATTRYISRIKHLHPWPICPCYILRIIQTQDWIREFSCTNHIQFNNHVKWYLLNRRYTNHLTILSRASVKVLQMPLEILAIKG